MDKIIFTPKTVLFVLEALGIIKNKQGYAVYKSDNRFVFDADGFPFKPKDLIGIINKKFITNFLQILNI